MIKLSNYHICYMLYYVTYLVKTITISLHHPLRFPELRPRKKVEALSKVQQIEQIQKKTMG